MVANYLIDKEMAPVTKEIQDALERKTRSMRCGEVGLRVFGGLSRLSICGCMMCRSCLQIEQLGFEKSYWHAYPAETFPRDGTHLSNSTCTCNRDIFIKWDLDQDGFIDATELQKGLSSLSLGIPQAHAHRQARTHARK